MKIRESVLKEMLALAREQAPIEACGYLAGTNETITHFYPMTNVDNSPEHFSLDPAEQFTTVRKMRAEGLRLMGVFHSHPASPARPSAEDIRLANDPSISYVILSLQAEAPVTRAFQIKDGSASPQPFDIEV